MHGTSLITVSGNTALIARALSLHAPLLLRNKVLFGCCFRTDGIYWTAAYRSLVDKWRCPFVHCSRAPSGYRIERPIFT
jgi:hypothetical protein